MSTTQLSFGIGAAPDEVERLLRRLVLLDVPWRVDVASEAGVVRVVVSWPNGVPLPADQGEHPDTVALRDALLALDRTTDALTEEQAARERAEAQLEETRAELVEIQQQAVDLTRERDWIAGQLEAARAERAS